MVNRCSNQPFTFDEVVKMMEFYVIDRNEARELLGLPVKNEKAVGTVSLDLGTTDWATAFSGSVTCSNDKLKGNK